MTKAKNQRLNIIKEILKKGEVPTQTELKKKLRKAKIDVSHATISRALKELGYARSPIGDGSYRLIKVEGRDEHIDLLFRLGLEEIIPVGNLILIKTRPGNAQAVAGAIDRSRLEGILGTIGGDDTILAVTQNESTARRVVKNLRKMLE
jgi:transcriptional regulator of arginine metabolism